MGAMKMKIARDDIAEVLASFQPSSDSPVKAARARGISVSLQNEGQIAPSEINVIGYTVDDATRAVEKFVDHAFLAGLPRVRVVHGSGMGILRKALRQALQAASPRRIGRRAPAKRRRRRRHGSRVAGVSWRWIPSLAE